MEDDVKKLKLGEKIRELRLKRGNTLKHIAEITGLSAANVSMKVHRIKALLARRYLEERNHA